MRQYIIYYTQTLTYGILTAQSICESIIGFTFVREKYSWLLVLPVSPIPADVDLNSSLVSLPVLFIPFAETDVSVMG